MRRAYLEHNHDTFAEEANLCRLILNNSEMFNFLQVVCETARFHTQGII